MIGPLLLARAGMVAATLLTGDTITLKPSMLIGDNGSASTSASQGSYTASGCTVDVDNAGNAIFDRTKCAALWEKTTTPLDLTNGGDTLVLNRWTTTPTAVIDYDPSTGKAALPTGVTAVCEETAIGGTRNWSCRALADYVVGNVARGGGPIVYQSPAGISITTVQAKAPGMAPTPPPTATGGTLPAEGTCDLDVNYDPRTTICVIVHRDRSVSLEPLPARFAKHIVAPNTEIPIVVAYPADMAVEVKLGGKRGIYEPPADDRGYAGGASKAPYQARRWSFAPRLPGEADATVTITDGAGKKTVETIELVVEKSYSGALRLGVGLVFPTPREARDRSYSATQLPGSDQREIIMTESGPVEFELVLGYAPFAFDFARGRGGRRYVSQTLRQRSLGFSPYVGLGVLQANKSGVQALKSVHLGLEWEPQRNFSIALTFMARRVERLGPGLEIGQPFEGDTVPTRQTIRFAVGLVLNLSPEFFRFATKNSASFLAQGGS